MTNPELMITWYTDKGYLQVHWQPLDARLGSFNFIIREWKFTLWFSIAFASNNMGDICIASKGTKGTEFFTNTPADLNMPIFWLDNKNILRVWTSSCEGFMITCFYCCLCNEGRTMLQCRLIRGNNYLWRNDTESLHLNNQGLQNLCHYLPWNCWAIIPWMITNTK